MPSSARAKPSLSKSSSVTTASLASRKTNARVGLRWGHLLRKSVCFSMCAGSAYWGHFPAKSFAISTNGSIRSESTRQLACPCLSLPPPTLRERRHRDLSRRLVAVRRPPTGPRDVRRRASTATASPFHQPLAAVLADNFIPRLRRAILAADTRLRAMGLVCRLQTSSTQRGKGRKTQGCEAKTRHGGK